MLNALTIDVEDYFQVTGFESVVKRDDWDQYPSRVVANTRRILEILDRYNTKGTFFVLGWVANKFPYLVEEIDDAGHEIGSHSFWHRLIYKMTPDEFREDLQQSKRVIEDIIGRQISAYRAPTFSITKQSLWALDILVEEGFEIDSSIFPTRHDRYGIPDSKQEIHDLETHAGSIREFPMSVSKLMGVTVPASGGGYFRLYPYRTTKQLIKNMNQKGQPLMFYLHPWEIDPQQPVVDGVSLKSRWRHRVNLSKTASKLNRLLSDFQFDAMSDVLKSNGHEPYLDRDKNPKPRPKPQSVQAK